MKLQKYLLLLSKSLRSCPTLCDPIDGSPPSSPVPGILQARTLEWVAISFSNAWKWKVKVKSLSRVLDCSLPGSSVHGIFQARVLEWGAIAFSITVKDRYQMQDCLIPHELAGSRHYSSSCQSATLSPVRQLGNTELDQWAWEWWLRVTWSAGSNHMVREVGRVAVPLSSPLEALG